MTFIQTTPPEEATEEAREMFARQQRAFGYLPNYAKVFGDRADIMDLWAALLSGIRKHIDARRFELVTLSAARELGSSYCALAHAKVLQERYLGPEAMRAAATGDVDALAEPDAAVMELARKVIADASSVTQEDIDRVRRAGLRDPEIFDVVAAAAGRAFFAKLVDSLGVLPDRSYLEMDEDLRDALTVGRPISETEVERYDFAEGAVGRAWTPRPTDDVACDLGPAPECQKHEGRRRVVGSDSPS